MTGPQSTEDVPKIIPWAELKKKAEREGVDIMDYVNSMHAHILNQRDEIGRLRADLAIQAVNAKTVTDLQATVYGLRELLRAVLATGLLDGHPIKVEVEDDSRPDVPAHTKLCVACEGHPMDDNNPCAVCGMSTPPPLF